SCGSPPRTRAGGSSWSSSGARRGTTPFSSPSRSRGISSAYSYRSSDRGRGGGGPPLSKASLRWNRPISNMFRLLMSRRVVVGIMLNGGEREVEEGTILSELLSTLGLPSEGTAVEVNGRVVPRAAAGDLKLRAGDRVEVVTLVGGG